VRLPPWLRSPANFRAFLRRRFSREGALGLYFTIGFFACAFLVVLLSLMLDEVFEIGSPGRVDRAVTLAVRDLQTPARDQFFRTVTNVGDFRFLIPATLLIAGILAWRHRFASGLLYVASVLGGFLLETLMKITLRRDRPDLWPALVTEKTYSFPSGHATMATVFFAGLAAVVFHVTRRRRARALAACLAALFIVAVGLSRIYLGVHWLTDVFGGILVGLLWVVAAATATEVVVGRRSDRPGRTR